LLISLLSSNKKTDLLKFQIPIPEYNLMKEFDSMVEPFFIKMNNNDKFSE